MENGVQKIFNGEPRSKPSQDEAELCRYFYSHRPDPNTPIEETIGALYSAIQQGRPCMRTSNYTAEQTEAAIKVLKQLGVPCLIHQPKYSMFERWVEGGLLAVLEKNGVGCIPFSPLAQGLLTDRYLKGIPQDSRAGKEHGFLKAAEITEEKLDKIRKLNQIATSRNQTLAQMALSWLLKDKRITTVLIGASSVQQLDNNIDTLNKLDFTNEELNAIEKILG
jgi:L-glyceraldehyde 3-phosphate reductase